MAKKVILKPNVKIPKKVGRPRKSASKDKPMEHYNPRTGKIEQEVIDVNTNRVFVGSTKGLMLSQTSRFKSAEELIDILNDYFENGGTVVTSEKRTGESVTKRVLSLSGLIYHLGFDSMKMFYEAEKHKEYGVYIRRAKMLVMRNYEEMLQTSSNPTGAIFALKQFGWKDNTASEVNVTFHPFVNMMQRASIKDEPKKIIDEC